MLTACKSFGKSIISQLSDVGRPTLKVFLVILIIFTAFLLRFYNIEQIPPGIYPDEALNANEAVNALETGIFKIFYDTNNGREGLFINLIALSFSIFGIGIWQLKLISALAGALTVLGIYLLTKTLIINLASRTLSLLSVRDAKLIFWVPLLAALFLATSFWHINFSRISFRAILVPLFLTFGFWVLLTAFKKQRWHYYAIAGLIVGLGFYTYPAFRIAPLLLFFAILWYFFKAQDRKKYLINISIFFVIFIMVLSPLAIYFLQHSEIFSERANQVSVFNIASPVYEILKNTTLTLGQFNIKGDCNWRHNYNCQPLLFWPVGIFFIIGIFLAFKNIKHFPFSFLLLWFFASLLPAILTNEGLPHSLRSISSIIPAYIFIAFGFTCLLFHLETQSPKQFGDSISKWFVKLLLILIFIYSIYLPIDTYFNIWAKNDITKNQFNQYLIEAADYLNSLPDDVIKYVILDTNGVWIDGVPIQSQTIKFITHGKKNIIYLRSAHSYLASRTLSNAIILKINNSTWELLSVRDAK